MTRDFRPLEVVPYPHRKPRLPPRRAAAVTVDAAAVLAGEHDVLPGAVEERPPGPVEVDREAERERLEAEAVRRAAVLQPESADVARRAVNQQRIAVHILPRSAGGIHLIADDRRADFRRTRGELVPAAVAGIGRRLAVEPRAADARKKRPADTADDANRRQRRLDERKAELGVGKDRVLSGELEVVVAAELGVAAEVQEVGGVAKALEAAHARRQQ